MDTRDDVPQREIRKLPPRELKDPLLGKRFFDEGDYVPGKKKKKTIFNSGEFLVLCRQPGTGDTTPCYWCERVTGGDGGKRDIQQFGLTYVENRVDKYDKE